MLLIWHGQPFGGTPPTPTPAAPSTTGGWRDYDFLNKPPRDVIEAERARLARDVPKQARKEIRRAARKLAETAPPDTVEAIDWARHEQARALSDAMLRTALDRAGTAWSPELLDLIELELMYLLAFQREDEGAIIALLMEL